MNETPKAIVIRAAGTNCDAEMLRAFNLAGAQTQLIHLTQLIKQPTLLDAADLIGFPGGFSFGDDIASGRAFALKCREHLWPALRAAVQRRTPIIGVCNGFQILAQLGLLPGTENTTLSDEPPTPTIALAENAGGLFIDNWARIEINHDSPCVWTKNIYDQSLNDADREHVLRLPLASGEGRLITQTPALANQLTEKNQIPIRYIDNLNGSQNAIAAISDPTGLILGLMPHPDRYLDWNLHPYWTRLPNHIRTGTPPGLRMFQSAVQHVIQTKAARKQSAQVG